MTPQERPTEIAQRALDIRRKGLTPEQRERRRVVAERAEYLQEHGVKRGPNAPKDGTFGGTPSNA